MADEDMERTTLRLPGELLALIKAEARKSGRSLNGEILFRLRQSYAQTIDYAGLPAPTIDSRRVAEDSTAYRGSVHDLVRAEVARQLEGCVESAVERQLRQRDRGESEETQESRTPADG